MKNHQQKNREKSENFEFNNTLQTTIDETSQSQCPKVSENSVVVVAKF